MLEFLKLYWPTLIVALIAAIYWSRERFSRKCVFNRRFLRIFLLTPTQKRKGPVKLRSAYHWSIFNPDVRLLDMLGGWMYDAKIFRYVVWWIFPLIQVLLVASTNWLIVFALQYFGII